MEGKDGCLQMWHPCVSRQRHPIPEMCPCNPKNPSPPSKKKGQRKSWPSLLCPNCIGLFQFCLGQTFHMEGENRRNFPSLSSSPHTFISPSSPLSLFLLSLSLSISCVHDLFFVNRPVSIPGLALYPTFLDLLSLLFFLFICRWRSGWRRRWERLPRKHLHRLLVPPLGMMPGKDSNTNPSCKITWSCLRWDVLSLFLFLFLHKNIWFVGSDLSLI